MTVVRDVVSALETYAPQSLALEWDNCGLLVGRQSGPVSAMLLALDITSAVIDEAGEMKAELIISHHPLFFSLDGVTDLTAQSKLALRLIENGMAACCMHTNLDVAEKGVNFQLMRAMEMPPPYVPFSMLPQGGAGEGLYADLGGDKPFASFAARVKKLLGCSAARCFDAKRPVSRVGVCSGSGGKLLEKAFLAGCDTFISGDIKHDVFLQAGELGINLADMGHFATEQVVLAPLAEYLRDNFPALTVTPSTNSKEPFICL